jgi:hypothetical protein
LGLLSPVVCNFNRFVDCKVYKLKIKNNILLSKHISGVTCEKNQYTAISIKVVHEESGKVEYERERLLGIANKLMNFQSYSQQPFALVFDFSALLVDNLN